MFSLPRRTNAEAAPSCGYAGTLTMRDLLKQSRRAAARNAHAERRLVEMRAICPDLSDDVLATTDLRTLSVAVRRARGGKQTMLHAHNPAPPGDNAAQRENAHDPTPPVDNAAQHDSRKCVETAQIVMGRY